MPLKINIDDFLLTDRISQGMLYCLKNKYCDQISVLANGLADLKFVDAFHKYFPNKPVSIHLCLSCGQKVKPLIKTNNNLISQNGFFVPIQEFRSKANSFDYSFVEAELYSQLEKLKSLSFNVTHANFHHHAGFLDEKIFEIYCEFLLKNKLSSRSIASSFGEKFKKLKIPHNDFFIEKSWSNINAKEEISQILKYKNKNAELNAHASFANKDTVAEIHFLKELVSAFS